MSARKPVSSTSRLRQDYVRLKRDPVPYIIAEPIPNNILEWHYVVTGPENTPYEGGFYHGKLIFPKEFPFKPPAIYMLTPNGRFSANKKLCLSISDYHPDTWNPAWSVSTILTGLLSFMLEKSPTLGSIETTDYDKRQFAYKSLEHNLKNKDFCDLFPDLRCKLLGILEKRTAAINEVVADSENSRSVADQSGLQSYILNFVVLIGVIAFAFTVKYVMAIVASEMD